MDSDFSQSKDISEQRFLRRELELYHPTYDKELAFYELVKSGDLSTLGKKTDWDVGDEPDKGVLSKNPLRNSKYHLIVMVAMITRFCIEGGLNEQEAYQLSDIFINRIDEENSKPALILLHKEIVFAFAKRMRRLKIIDDHSVHCKKALDYIYNHLHENIRISEIAQYVNLDETYISKLFLQEIGMTLGVYIRRQKIEESKNMLMYSNLSCGDIAQFLGFSSSSHFAKTFKAETGQTPLDFRNSHYRKHWS